MFDIKFTIHFKFPELVPSPESAYLRSQMSYRMKILITACKMTLLSFLAVAQTMAQDSVKDSASYLDNNFYNKTQRLTDKIIQSKAFQMTYIGVPLIAGGLIIKHQDNHFLELRNAYAPDLRYLYDDYLTLVPAAAMLGLKVAGVEGRSSWGRMLVSDAFSAALVATAVNTLKYTTKVTRPDGSKQNSFPSGHTAVAFMSATMLHKEYGLTRSPWYSVAGYTWATGIGLSRILNNRHWLSDVLAGAGIGILSTELGYFLADLIFKEKGITHELFDMSAYDYQRPPSFFSLHLGLNKMPTKITLPSGIRLQTTLGSSAGFEGAWFMNRTVGLVASTVASGLSMNICTADQYISIILTGNMFKDIYKQKGYESCLLSRTVEDSTTVTSVLVPWNSCGMTQATILGVPTLTYLPYCFFNLLSPLMSILVAITGFKIKQGIAAQFAPKASETVKGAPDAGHVLVG